MIPPDITPETQEFSEILQQIQTAKKRAVQQINNTLVELYWGLDNTFPLMSLKSPEEREFYDLLEYSRT